MPGPPAGMQRPGVPGAGNILDPAVRGDIRESLHDPVHQACGKAAGRQAPEEIHGDKQQPAACRE